MTALEREYASKLLSMEALVQKMGPGQTIQFGVWYGQPYGAMAAVAKHGAHLDPVYFSTNIITGVPEFMGLPGARVLCGFLGAYERGASAARGNLFYTPMHYTDGIRSARACRPVDFFIQRVAPMDERGCFNFSLTSSFEYNTIRWIRQHRPETKIVFEVNPNLPRVGGVPGFGGNELSISHCDYIVEDSTPLMEFPTAPANEAELAIARNVVELVEDRATVQLGFGTIPMAIGGMLKERRGLGIHTEMFCEAHIDLIEAGAVTNEHKGLHDGLSVATFALGTKRLHAFLKDNPKIAMLPVEEVNSPPVVARIRKATSVNSILTIDMTGQACAHTLNGKTYSGLGGAFEFTYGAQLSPGGRSILCLPSTAKLKDGREVSNIVAAHPPRTRVTIPEHLVDWVVTEHGAARLKFLTIEQRAAALAKIAHPKFREQLERESAAGGLDPAKAGELPAPPAEFFLGAAAEA